jgi:hypothetical protein
MLRTGDRLRVFGLAAQIDALAAAAADGAMVPSESGTGGGLL